MSQTQDDTSPGSEKTIVDPGIRLHDTQDSESSSSDQKVVERIRSTLEVRPNNAVGHAVVNTEHRKVAAFLTAALQQNDVLDASIRVGIDLIHRPPRIARTFGFVRDLEYVALLVLAKNVVVSESDRTRPSCRENDHCYYVPEARSET